MRRRALPVSILLLAGALLAWRRRRARADSPPLQAPAPPAPPLAPAPPPPRFVSVPWTLAAAPADAPELTLRYECSEQMELDRVDAQETPTQVFVTVLMRWHPPAGGRFAWEQQHETTVALSGPLGPRALVHAPVDVTEPASPAGADPNGPALYP